MRRHKKKIIFIIICSTLVFTLPCLINLSFIGSQIEKTAGKMYDSNVRIQKVHWRWFPSPAISLTKTVIENAMVSAEIDGLAISPSLSSLLSGTITINGLEITTPKIKIKSLEAVLKQKTGEKKIDVFPSLDLRLTDGELMVPFDGRFKKTNDRIHTLNISKINLDLNSNTDKITLSTSLTTPYIENLYTEMSLQQISEKTTAEDLLCEIQSKAQNINLSQLRKTLLILFSGNEDVQEVFGETVLSGRATDAGFSFKGTVAELENLDTMVATADIENARIHIPETKILLNGAKGSLKMEHSVLTGENIVAKLKNSSGKNGRLFLGLAEDDFRFNLDIDIDADLSDLLGTIDEFIDLPGLKKQLAGIKNLKGKTPFNLKLKDDLNDLKTYVSAPSLSGSFHYDLLMNDITVNEGALLLSPESISWNGISCDIGPGSLSKVSGSIELDTDYLLTATGETSTVDSKDIHKILSSWPRVAKQTEKIIQTIDGEVELAGFKVSGPVKKPSALNYELTINTGTLTLSSPLLPESTSLSFNSATVSDKKISVSQMRAKLKESVFSISTNLDHHLLSGLTGSVIINGIAGNELTPWVREKDWFHKAFQPKLPCNFSPLSVFIKDGSTSVTGNLIHGEKINTLVDIKVGKNKKVNGTLELLSPTENAFIRIKYPESPEDPSIGISFTGDVSRDTIAAVIDNNQLPGDNLNGRFDLLYPVEKNRAVKMTGSAEIININVPLNKNGAILLDRLTITGENDYADLHPGKLTLVCPDNLKSVIKKNPVASELKSRIYFQYDEFALLKILNGSICGVNIAGEIGIPSEKLDFMLSPENAKQLTFDELFSCLGIRQVKITGDLSVSAHIKGSSTDISGSTLKIKAVDGVIKKANLLAKLLSLVDLTELFRKNPLEKLKTTGYHYDSIEIDAVVNGRKLHILRAAVLGSGVNLYGTGDIDLETMEVDMVVLASPLKAIDNIITSLPIIGSKMGGKSKSVISVPMKIEGKPGEMKIRFIPKRLTDVSSDIIDVFVKTFKLPFEFSYKLVKPDRKKQTISD